MRRRPPLIAVPVPSSAPSSAEVTWAAAVDAADDLAGQYLDAGRACALDQRRRRRGAGVGDGGDGDACGVEVEGGGISAVVVGADDRPLARLDRVLVGVALRRRGQHDARLVVVAEYQGSLDGAGRQHDLPCAHDPQPLPRRELGWLRQVVVGPFQQADGVAVVIAERRGARQQRDVGLRRQVGDLVIGPIAGRGTVDGLALEAQRAAQGGAFVDQHDATAGFAGGARRG